MLEKKILVIDDDQSVLRAMPMVCDLLGYDCKTSSSYSPNLLNEVGLVVLDIRLPRVDGYEIYQKIKKIKDIPIILHSAYAGVNEDKYKALNPFAYIDKGSKNCYGDLVDAIRRGLDE